MVKRFRNLSDGVSDGIVIFYMKDGKLHPSALDQEQAEMLDLAIVAPFVGSRMMVSPTPVEYKAIKEMIII